MTKDKFKTICIEGMDGAGKNTQSNLLRQVYEHKNIPVQLLSFPNYDSMSSFGVTEILQRDRIIDLDNNLKYIKCATFAMDRALTIFNKENEKLQSIIKNGGVLLFDRYTTSNILHVASVLDTVSEVDDCINFIQYLEYDKFKLPKPDNVFFLDVHPDVSLNNIKKRGRATDFNETPEHLYKVYERSNYVVEKMGWVRIECTNANLSMKSSLEIHFDICRNLNITYTS